MANYAMVNKASGLVENVIVFDDGITLIEITADNSSIQRGGTVINGQYTPPPAPDDPPS